MQSLKDNDGQLKLANVTEKISSLLTITKLATVFETYDSVEEAVGAFVSAFNEVRSQINGLSTGVLSGSSLVRSVDNSSYELRWDPAADATHSTNA